MLFFNRRNRVPQVQDPGPKPGEGKTKWDRLYSFLLTLSGLGAFVAIGLLAIAMTGLIKISSGLVLTLALVGIVCLAAMLCLPWIKYIIRKEHQKTAIVFLSLIAVCTVLWVISAVFIYTIWQTLKGSNPVFTKRLIFIQIAFIITLQFALASLVASTILRYGKKMLVFQIIMYLSCAFCDFYASFAICCISSKGGGLGFTSAIGFLGHPVMISMFVLFFVWAVLSRSMFSRIIKRRALRAGFNPEDPYGLEEDKKPEPAQPAKQEPSTKERLSELKEMLDQGLISQEEFDAKKEELLKNM